MKTLIEIENNNIDLNAYKNIIDNLINSNTIDKLKLQENYFDITQNYWIIDKYIAMGGQYSLDLCSNTLQTYEKAIEEGYAISIPVQMLDDEKIVCFSHKNISKVVSSQSGYLNNFSYDQLKSLVIYENGQTVPTLEEALDTINNQTPIIIEIINEGMIGKFEDKVLSLLQKYITKHNTCANVAIMSINPYSLEYCYNKYPYITRILKSGKFEEKMYGSLKTRKLKTLKYYPITHADFICYTAENLPSRHVKKCKPVGIIANNVQSQNQYIAVAPKCDNIIFSHFKPTI